MQRVIDFSKRAVKLARSSWYTEHVTIAGENFSVKVYGSYVQVIRHNETGVQDGHHCRTKKEAELFIVDFIVGEMRRAGKMFDEKGAMV